MGQASDLKASVGPRAAQAAHCAYASSSRLPCYEELHVLHSSKVFEPQSMIIVDAESTLSDISVLALCGTFYHTCAIMITACSVGNGITLFTRSVWILFSTHMIVTDHSGSPIRSVRTSESCTDLPSMKYLYWLYSSRFLRYFCRSRL